MVNMHIQKKLSDAVISYLLLAPFPSKLSLVVEGHYSIALIHSDNALHDRARK